MTRTEGQGLVEYGLLLLLVALVIIGILYSPGRFVTTSVQPLTTELVPR